MERLGTVKTRNARINEAGFYIVFRSGLTRNVAAVAR
jgi:hypothetical protein